jgi:hypothetical protein
MDTNMRWFATMVICIALVTLSPEDVKIIGLQYVEPKTVR